MPAVSYVGLTLPVHEEGVPGDPELGTGMVLSVQGEHTAGPDHEMVEVATTLADRDGVEETPARVGLGELRQTSGHFFLAVCPYPPRPLISVDSEHPGDEGEHRSFVLEPHRLRSGRSTWPAVGQVFGRLRRRASDARSDVRFDRRLWKGRGVSTPE